MFDVAAPDDKHGGTKRRRKIPKSHKPASWKALEGIAWILTYTKLSSIYSTEFMLGDKFMLYSFPRRCVRLEIRPEGEELTYSPGFGLFICLG